jgi:hypothetical protein
MTPGELADQIAHLLSDHAGDVVDARVIDDGDSADLSARVHVETDNGSLLRVTIEPSP